MSKLQDEFNKIIAKIEERFTNREDLEFVKQQILDVSMLYMAELEKVVDLSERRVNQVVENQKILDKKQTQIEDAINKMEKELFVGEEDYDFEIVCPYCNHEFISEIGSNIKDVKCPECNNTIELDWNDEEEDCGGHCSSCAGCGHNEEYDNQEENEEEDDM